ncbi:MAG TPA: hypothetical protein VMA75_02610 [Candidatus Paceibacterota bacterium]|nr:hypothetical protein [Candidatus Paceibacterota bacterium]
MTKRGQEMKNFLDEAVGFVEMFDRIMAEGFIDDLNVNVTGFEGKGITSIVIRGTGYLPADRRAIPLGITPFINPATIVEGIRKQLLHNRFRIDSRRCEIKTDDWAKWDRSGENVIGSRGLRIIFDFMVFLKPKQWEDKK